MKTQIPFDTYKTDKGNLKITVLGHASLLFQYEGKNIYIDPYSKVADFSLLPKADLILITHEHLDHLDEKAIDCVKKADTQFIASSAAAKMLGQGESIGNGGKSSFHDIEIEAVPAYNIVHQREPGVAFHPKGIGNGYVLTFDNIKVYVAGDTENIPEMDTLKGKIDIAFLPKNLPYTMDDEMFIDAARRIQPKILYPYHMSEFDEAKIGKALKDTSIELKIRPMSNL